MKPRNPTNVEALTSLLSDLKSLKSLDTASAHPLIFRAIGIAHACLPNDPRFIEVLNNVKVPHFDRMDRDYGGRVDKGLWAHFVNNTKAIFESMLETYSLSTTPTNASRLHELQQQFFALDPSDRLKFKLLKSRAAAFARNTFGVRSQYHTDILNIDLSPPTFANPMADEVEVADATDAKLLEAYEDMAIVIATMRDDPKIDEVIKAETAPSKPVGAGHHSANFRVQGDHNTIIVQSPGSTIAPAPIDLGALEALVADNTEAADQLKALVAELTKPPKETKWAKILDFAGGVIKFAPTAARILGPWLGHPDTIHYANALPTTLV